MISRSMRNQDALAGRAPLPHPGALRPDARLLGTRLLGTRLLGTRLLGTRLLGTPLLGTPLLGTLLLGMLLLGSCAGSQAPEATAAEGLPQESAAETGAERSVETHAEHAVEAQPDAPTAAPRELLGHRGVAIPDETRDDPDDLDEGVECMMGLDCNDHPLAGCDGVEFAVRYRARCIEGACAYVEQRERCMEGMQCMETFAGARCVPRPEEVETPVPARASVDFSTRQLIINTNIRFDVASATIRSSAEAILDEVAAVLADAPQVRVRIDGHTDDTGREETNRTLSLSRAEAVREALEARGIARERLEVRGLGQDAPLVPNEADWQREVNRRVEFHLVDSDAD